MSRKAPSGNVKNVKLTKLKAIKIRDHLMVSLCYHNCLRASNLTNISLEDVKKIEKHHEIEEAWVLTNEEYKVSMIYGAKIILLDSILNEQIKNYIELFRPLVTADDHLADTKRYLFTSSRIFTNKPLGQKMDHSAISNSLTAIFKKALVSDKKDSSRTSCSGIRMSVITEIVSMGQENTSTFATCFAKHSESVCKKYYVQHYSEREAARISWSCYQKYSTSDDIKKAAKIRQKIVDKQPVVSVEK